MPIYGTTDRVRFRLMDSLNALDRMVQRTFKAFLDACPGDDRADLANSLPDHSRDLRVRVRAGDPTQGAVAGGVALRYQFRVKPDLHTDPIRDAEPATGGVRYPGRVGHDHLDDGCCLAVLSLGGSGSNTLFCVGVAGDGATTEHHLDELGKIMIRKTVALFFLILTGSFVMAAEVRQLLFDFSNTDSAKEWQNINDGVMGGVSDGKFKITDTKTLEFYGTLSLENNGGFASVRTRARQLRLEKGDTVVAKVRGDGREYTLNLYVNKPLIAFSYKATVQTKKDEWIEIKVPLDKFEATSFGRVLKDAGPVDPKDVNSLGFMLSDKKAGSFKLEVESIQVERTGK